MKSNRQARQLLSLERWASNKQKIAVQDGKESNVMHRTGRKKK